MNKRDGINEILLSLNELPLDVADAVEDIQIAVIVDKWLDISKRKVLSYGWNFNTLTMNLVPNNLGYISIPQTFLSVDGTGTTDLVVRDWKLFDKDTLSFIFTDPQEVEVIEDIPFDDIPFHYANYIIQFASLQSYINIVGNNDDIAVRRESLNAARIEALRDEANSLDGNLLTNVDTSTLLDRTSI